MLTDSDSSPVAAARRLPKRDRAGDEWAGAIAFFALHPTIEIQHQNDSPAAYRVRYRVRTLIAGSGGSGPAYVESAAFDVSLAPPFPEQAPLLRPVETLFHPNIDELNVWLKMAWQPADRLAGYLQKIGEILAYRSYDPSSVVNAAALDWLEANLAVLPSDPSADFSADAGGARLDRIALLGPKTLDEFSRESEAAEEGMLAGGEVEGDLSSLAARIRARLVPLTEKDVPEPLRNAAAQRLQWAAEFAKSSGAWKDVRERLSAAKELQKAIDPVGEAARSLAQALRLMELAMKEKPAEQPATALTQIPPAPVLQVLQIKLPNSIVEAEQAVQNLHAAMRSLDDPAPPAPSVASPLGQRLAERAAEAATAYKSARESATKTLTGMTPLLRRAHAESVALDHAVEWREYSDLFAKAGVIEQRLAKLGSEGVGAWYLESEGQTSGPFEFEQPAPAGTMRLAVRSLEEGVEIVDADRLETMGRGNALKLAVRLRGPALSSSNGPAPSSSNGPAQSLSNGPAHSQPVTLRISESCDELALRLRFIDRQTTGALERVHQPVPGARSWCGQILSVLADPRAQQLLHGEHRKATHRWRRIIEELESLGRFKERLATYWLLRRLADAAPAAQERLESARREADEATKRVASIVAKCGRDQATGRLAVPPKLLKQYTEAMEARDRSVDLLQKSERRLKTAADQARERLGDAARSGRADLPALRTIRALPSKVLELGESISDASLKVQALALQKILGVQLPKLISAPAPESNVRRHHETALSGQPSATEEVLDMLAVHEVDAQGGAPTDEQAQTDSSGLLEIPEEE